MMRKRRKEGKIQVVMKLVVFFLLFFLYSNSIFVYAEDNLAPPRVINVVYDDSGSMINTDGKYVDTWCQAKYAMEIFGAMLGDNDIMNIYYMSDFDSDTKAGPKLSLHGKDGSQRNVKKIHNMISEAANTPFNAVRKAYLDLTEVKDCEKWLVVLTDGAFQDGEKDRAPVNEFFEAKKEDIRVMFLSMGLNAEGIRPDESEGIFFEEAKTNDEILNKVVEISARIFNSNRLKVDSSKSIAFDVPMRELVVFAQGKKVSIKGIKDSSGNLFETVSPPVNVKYSEVASLNKRYRYDPDKYKISKKLKGQIATFKGDFDSGVYQLDVTGADTIEVYYKPNIEITAYLTNQNGEEVTNLSDIKAGKYIISFGFVKAGTLEKVKSSELLGEVAYSALVNNNGKDHPKEYSSGDEIQIEEGTLKIDVLALYLKYNYVSTHLEHQVLSDKILTFEEVTNKPFTVTKMGLDNKVPITLKTKIDGKDVTKAEWDEMGIPSVTMEESKGSEMYGDFKIEKSEQPGIYHIYPRLGSIMSSNIYESFDYLFSFEEMHGVSKWSGKQVGKVTVNDTRTWVERFILLIIKWGIIGGILLFILGYIPPFKKYLPKRLKTHPTIDCSSKAIGGRSTSVKGRYRKYFFSTLIPYKAEEGDIKISPPNVPSVPRLRIKALGGGKMALRNTRSFAGKSNITFNGMDVPEEITKQIQLRSGAMIIIDTPEMTYTCVLNQ